MTQLASSSDFVKATTVINSVLRIPLLDDTIGKFILLEVLLYICLPQSLTDVKKFATALSHCAAHRIGFILTCITHELHYSERYSMKS